MFMHICDSYIMSCELKLSIQFKLLYGKTFNDLYQTIFKTGEKTYFDIFLHWYLRKVQI